MSRFLLALAAREGQERALYDKLAEELRALRGAMGDDPIALRLMIRDPEDPFAARYKVPRPFDAALECEASWQQDPLSSWLDGLADRLENLIHADLSGALAGEAQVLAGARGGSARFLYFMRRKAGVSHDFFVRYWAEEHSRFGRQMPGILAYEQLFVDPVASRVAAARAGFGVWGVDGVANLHLESLGEFLAAAVRSPVGSESIADEQEFVDGRNSIGTAFRLADEILS